ncbi:MAG: isoprenylcysteine carboxylmethyltransferase family protein [Oscillospiraceae bacterium]
MFFVVSGCAAFVFFYLFDFNKLYRTMPFGGVLFFLGCAVLFISSIGAFFSGGIRVLLSLPWMIVFAVLAMLSLLMMLWALFFSLPFLKTYVEGESGRVVDTGLYAVCRHPGVLFFALMYLCLWLVSGRDTMLAAAICWTMMDVLHVYVQDRWLFPKTLSGYEEYRLRVPFLIPNTASIRRGFETIRGKE